MNADDVKPGSVEIPAAELIELPEHGRFADIAMLHLLKRYGVPVHGTVLPRLISGIEYSRMDNIDTGGIVISWRRK